MGRSIDIDVGLLMAIDALRNGGDVVRGAILRGIAALLLALPVATAHGASAATAHGASYAKARGTAGRIVYVGADGNLYLIQPDGTGKRALTTDATATSPYAEPAWSASGAGILAIRFGLGLQAIKASTTGLWLASPSGGARQLLGNVPRGFAWAPDGHTAVYETGRYPARTTLVQLDTRTNQTHTIYCDDAFTLVGVTNSNAAIGVQNGQIETVSLADGTARALTQYPAKTPVLPNVIALARSGKEMLYSVVPQTQLISLDLRSNRSATINAGGTLRGAALSPDLRWVAYSTTAAGNTAASMLLRLGKSATALRGDSSVTPQAFAPDSAALAFTSLYDGPAYIFTATTDCPARCARRLALGHDAAWGP